MTRMRTRPDEAGKAGYITPAGHRSLQEEAERLWTVERPKLVKAVAVAAAEGDRSENAEYIYGKRKLAEIDRRLTYLGKRLEVLRVVDAPPVADGRIYFGAWVELEDEHGVTHRYRIVGSDEADAESQSISIDSPLAKALMRKSSGDEITVQRPKGEITYVVLNVSYEPGC
jgi:transcription elongation factor GreB